MLTLTKRRPFSSRIPGVTRTIREFSESEVVIPDGPFAGQRYDVKRQPYVVHYLDAIDSNKYQRFAAVGPTQSGKTLTCSMLPLLYHLFDQSDSVVFGLPDINMVSDKFSIDFLPVVNRTRYSEFLPTRGRGSQGGIPSTIKFTNGAALRFMTGGGSDKQRAGFTARALVVSEVDGMDAPGKLSIETDKVTQLEGRLRAFRASGRDRTYLECTATIESGRIWQEWSKGTESHIQIKCQHCGEYVEPERKHLIGWQDAVNEMQARENAHFTCPVCCVLWSERDRVNAVRDSKLVDSRASQTFSFRWSAVHNLFATTADIAEDEWRNAQRPDRDNAERELCQFVWAIPWKPALLEDSLPIELLKERSTGYPRGKVDASHDITTLGIDVGKQLLHCAYLGMNKATVNGMVIDYESVYTKADILGTDGGIVAACEQIENKRRQIGIKMVLIDEGWLPDLIRTIARKYGWNTCRGFGSSQRGASVKFYEPKAKGGMCQWVGDRCHGTMLVTGETVIEHDSDHGKTWVHHRFATPATQNGHVGIFGNPSEHDVFFRQILSEQLTEQNGKLSWVKKAGVENHYLDAMVLAGLGARMQGATIGKSLSTQPQTKQAQRHAKQKLALNRSPIRTRY